MLTPIQRIPDRQDVVQGQEHVGAPPARIAEHPADGAHPAQRELRAGDQRVRVEHPAQGDVHEEALHRELGRAELLVLEVPRDDAGVVSPVPGHGARPLEKAGPVRDRRPAGRPGLAGQQLVRLPRVPQQALVDRAPPFAPRPGCVRGGQQAPADLPPHEGHLGPAVGPDRDATGPVVVETARQTEAASRIVADRRHHAERLCRRITGHVEIARTAATMLSASAAASPDIWR